MLCKSSNHLSSCLILRTSRAALRDQSSLSTLLRWSSAIFGYGLDPMRPFQSTLLYLAGGTRSASEKSKLAVTLAQYAAVCFGLMVGPCANFTASFPCASFRDVVRRTVDAVAV